ncbi:MAG: hypothetical protein H7333_04040 [Bdellovibrionales bacterium]|nr:hypothetical protein [Oligoflexia bacterium]
MEPLKPGQQIVNAINYSLHDEIPHRWKICRIHAALKEEGFVPGSAEAFNGNLYRFYEKRKNGGQSKLIAALFGVKMTALLREELGLNYSDIAVSTSKVREVSRSVLELLPREDETFQNIAKLDFIERSLTRLYDVAHYSKISQFNFEDFKRAILAEAKVNFEFPVWIALNEKLSILDPDHEDPSEAENEEVPAPSEVLIGQGTRLTLVHSSTSAKNQSLTQAEVDWLQSLVKEGMNASVAPFPGLKGTAVTNDADYPPELRPLIKTTKLYSAQLQKGSGLSQEANEKIRTSIAAKAKEVLVVYASTQAKTR